MRFVGNLFLCTRHLWVYYDDVITMTSFALEHSQ